MLSRASGAAVPARRRLSEVDIQRSVNRKRNRDNEQEITVADDELFPPPGHPQNFNPERYPAYDENARRIGLDHLRFVKKAKANDKNADHYLPRTHTYPTGMDSSATTPTEPSQPEPLPRRSMQTLPPLAPDFGDEIDQLADDEPIRGRTEHSRDRDGGRKRSPKRAAPLADAADIPDSTPHVRDMLGLKPDQDVTLHALADPPPGEKPTYPYPLLIQLAILGSPKKRLTLAEIYSAIEDRFDWFKRTSDKAWQVSLGYFFE